MKKANWLAYVFLLNLKQLLHPPMTVHECFGYTIANDSPYHFSLSITTRTYFIPGVTNESTLEKPSQQLQGSSGDDGESESKVSVGRMRWRLSDGRNSQKVKLATVLVTQRAQVESTQASLRTPAIQVVEQEVDFHDQFGDAESEFLAPLSKVPTIHVTVVLSIKVGSFRTLRLPQTRLYNGQASTSP